ncbi:MAG: hypothetical protein AMS18_15640, partial [Gemmatimonas sp. SG8_17]
MKRVLRWLLRLFPVSFRDRYGDEVIESVVAKAGDSRRKRGRIAAAGVLVYQSLDLVKAAWVERTIEHSRPRTEHINRPRSFASNPKRDPLVASVWRDARLAVRNFGRSPGFTSVAVLTLALGVGANAAVFSIMDAVLLRPLPFEHPERLSVVQVNVGGPGWYGASEPEFIDFREYLGSFDGVAAYELTEATLGDTLAPLRLQGVRLTTDLIPMLGVEPLLGRLFTPEEDMPGAEPVILVSHGLWQQHFGGDPTAIGRTINLGGSQATVIGVMPEGFAFPNPDCLWWGPRQLDFEDPWTRNNHYLNILARLATGVTAAQAQSEADLLAASSIEAHPRYYAQNGYRIRVLSLKQSMVGDSRRLLLVIMGAVGFVLLTTCVNVAGLLLVRGERRRHEVAVRTALGAARRRVIRQLLTENLVLAAIGGIAGVALASLCVRALISAAPDSIPRLYETAISGRVLVFSLAIVALTGLVFGLVPALRAGATGIHETLIQAAPGQCGSGSLALRRVLVVSQLALAVLLAAGAGIMLRTIVNLYQVDAGFRPDNVVTMRIDPSPARFATQESRVAFWRDLEARVKRLPGVISAGAVPWLPLSASFPVWSYMVEGETVASIGDAPAAPVQQATPGYLSAMGLTLVRGRFFDPGDRLDTRPVAVINEAMARRHWAGEDPIGRLIKLYPEGRPWMEVVGVVRNVRDNAMDREARPKLYWS